MSTIKLIDQEQQTWLEAVLDAMPLAASCARIDDQQIIFQNEKFRELFGYQPGDHKTVRDWIEQTYVIPRQAKRAEEMWSSFYASSPIGPVRFGQVEVDVLCKDGSVKTTLLSGVMLPKENWGLAIFADITERKEQEKLAQKLALEDDLTGLPNRRAFSEMLKQYMSRARRLDKSTALLLIDLDGFKDLNDTRGHKAGDAALQIIADRLGRSIRLEDFVARVGGDEFAVIIDCVDNTETTVDVANRILTEVRDRPIIVEGREALLDLSIGIGIYPQDARDGDKLFKAADAALYRAKKKGRGCWSR